MLNLIAIALFQISSFTVSPTTSPAAASSTISAEAHGNGGWTGVAEHGNGGWTGVAEHGNGGWTGVAEHGNGGWTGVAEHGNGGWTGK